MLKGFVRLGLCLALVALFAWGCDLRSARLEYEIGSGGDLERLSADGQPVIDQVTVAIGKPGWKGILAALHDPKTVQVERRVGNEEQCSVEGLLKGEGLCAAFKSEWTREGNALRFRFEMVPKEDTRVAGMNLRIALPAERFKGSTCCSLCADGIREIPIPRTARSAQDNILLQGDQGEWFGWRATDRYWLKVVPDWLGGLFWCILKDNRAFNEKAFVLSFTANGLTDTLKSGVTYKLGVTLRVDDEALVAAEMDEIRRGMTVPIRQSRRLEIGSVILNATSVPRFGKLELTCNLSATFENPFDEEDVEVRAHILTPLGNKQWVPAFYYQDYERRPLGEIETLSPRGAPTWRVRYSPVEVGLYRYSVEARDRTGTVKSAEQTFECIPSQSKGFVRVSKFNPLYFEYDDGSGYFPIGHNVYRARSIWGYEREYKDYMTKMSAHGENYARVSVNALQNQFILALERARVGDQDAAGLGRYDLKNAWRLDRVLQLAEAHGICVTLGIENFPWFREKGEHARWAESPYNAANGGPCAEPAAFFTNPQAKKLYKRRLRYLVARWGYSPTILAWELWNEVNLVTGYASAPARDWHQEMARYLKALDVNRRLVATSYPTTPGDPRVEALPEMDYVQTHQYNSKDLAAEVSAVCLDKAHRYQKPHFFAETGLTPGTGLAEDPTGIHLHNAIWASAHSLGAGTAMLWWWDNYIEFRNLYHHYAALSKFVAGVQFNKHRFVPVKIESVHYSHPHPPRVRPLLLEGRSPVMKPQVLRVGSDGRVDAAETLSRNLYGTPDTVYWKHNPVTFKVNGDGPWRFSVWPATLYGKGAKIRARVDGRLELSKDLANPSGNSRSLAYEHAGEYAVNVPPGEHEIEVSNDGEGWLESAAYLFSGYCKPSDPPLRAFGLQEPGDPSDGLAALLWIQNTGNTWFLRSIGETPETVEDAVIRLRGFPDAEYQIEWWDTYGGKVIRREAAVGREALLEIPIPPVRADIVCKVFRGGRKGE